jgi:hypothetical protein
LPLYPSSVAKDMVMIVTAEIRYNDPCYSDYLNNTIRPYGRVRF